MKKTLLGLGMLLTGVASTQAQNGLEKIIVEKFYISNAADSIGSSGILPVGSVTYRLYADMLPGYNFQALYGVKGSVNHELQIKSSTKFFNNEDRGATSPEGIKLTDNKKNTVMLDSWFSVGAAAAGKIGVLKSDDTDGSIGNTDGILLNADTNAGAPISIKDGLMDGSSNDVTFVGLSSELAVFDDVSQVGSLFSTIDGSIASLGGSKGADNENRVLIGQFTTNGVFSFKLNVQIGTPGGDVQNYVAENPTGEEINISSLIGSFDPPSASNNVLPVVSISAPDSAVAGDEIEFTATASDADGSIVSVEFFVDGVSIGTDSVSPYAMKWKAKEGNVSIIAKAKDNKAAVSESLPKTVKVSKPTGINDLNTNSTAFTLFPNPVNDQLTIQFNGLSKSNSGYKIYGVSGKLIYQKDLGQTSAGFQENVDFSKLPAGLYLVELLNEDSSIFKKVVKQ